MRDFDQVGLVRHHLVDVLVGARDLIDHAAVLPTLDTFRLLREVEAIELLLRRRAAHAPACAVRARAERLRVPLAAHDERTRAHAARDDPELALARADRTL